MSYTDHLIDKNCDAQTWSNSELACFFRHDGRLDIDALHRDVYICKCCPYSRLNARKRQCEVDAYLTPTQKRVFNEYLDHLKVVTFLKPDWLHLVGGVIFIVGFCVLLYIFWDHLLDLWYIPGICVMGCAFTFSLFGTIRCLINSARLNTEKLENSLTTAYLNSET